MIVACRVFLSLVLFALLLSYGGRAAGGTLLLDLSGENWSIAPDPQNAGRGLEWWKGPTPDAKPARVPGIIQTVLPGYHGVAWYWRDFDAPANPYSQGRWLLRFGAVDYLAEVWVNGVSVGGHEGGETPFTLDITDAVKPGAANHLAVRVLNPTAEPIDGIVLAETPHRNKAPANITVGGMYNEGGITEPVELLWCPAVRIEDVFVRPDWKTGHVRIQATVQNNTEAQAAASICFAAGPARSGLVVADTERQVDLNPGDTIVEADLDVPDHQLWNVDNPYLYRLDTRLSQETIPAQDLHSVRFGFRDFRVEKGYFRLNGKRIFLRSSHTGNHCPVGQIIPPDNAPDLLRRDLLYMKASGFNAVRFIAGVAHPWQLDMCDEIGLMVYEESLAGWLLGDSPKMAERFDFSTREMILRDRNHPSVVIWGLLNETQDGPVFRHAVDSLALVRSLDETRLVLLDSGRWDGQFNIGSASNPGSAAWECVWGIESPDFKPAAGTPWTWIGGYMKDAGDAHVYPQTPHPPEVEKAIRSLGTDMKPVFLSEYGIGSLMNAVRELRNYEQHGVNPELDDFKYFRATVDKLDADWKRFGMDGVYASTEEMLRDSQWLHCRQRLFGFNLIRSNPKICGYNLTGLLDHGFTGEGLWSFWREFKPGIMDALQDGWAPLRWCLFSAPMHGYADRPFQLEAVLANEDVLAPGDYSVTLRVISPVGLAWERKTSVTIPAPVEGEDGPLAVPVFAEAVSLDGPPGEYVFAATMESGGAPTGGRLTFHVSAPPTAAEPQRTVLVSGIDEKIQEWLKSHGIACEAFEGSSLDASRVILVGEPSGAEAELAGRVELLKRIARGSVAVFLTPQAFKRGNDPVGWLPLKNKGRVYDFPDWLYHKECIAKAHPVFEGLQPKGIMDWDYYGPVISHSFLEGQDTPADVMAVAIAICHSAPPGGYAAGVMIGAYPFGAGKFVFNTLNVLGNVDQHPAADRLLLNLVRYAGTALGRPPSELPADFDEQLKDIGYE